MEVLIMVVQLILALSLLVGLHEAGHMLAAKFFGMRVEQFAIGFPPKILKFKIGETEYSLGIIPLGGFVKISGMVDESMDTEFTDKAPEPWEFRSKPAWQRLIVMLGGIIVNIITGVVIFSVLTFVKGETYIPITEVNKFGVDVDSLGQTLGLKRGDKILKVNGKDIKALNDIYDPNLLLEEGAYYTLERDGKVMDLPITQEFLRVFTTSKTARTFIDPLLPFRVKEVTSGSAAERAGLKSGDIITTVDTISVKYFQDFRKTLALYKENNVDLLVMRDSEIKRLSVFVDKDGRVGFTPDFLIEESHSDYSIGESFTKGTAKAFGVIALQQKAFGKIADGTLSVNDSLMSPIGMGQLFGGELDWLRFWSLTAMLSMVLAFMNVLPIPALDGGHVVFLLYEMIRGKAPSDKFLEKAQYVGMIILLTLMAYVFGKDLWGIISKFL